MLLLAEDDDMAAPPSPVPAMESPGLRGKRKSCSVVVGFMVKNGLVVAVGVVVLAAIVAQRNWTEERDLPGVGWRMRRWRLTLTLRV